jgi:O-antigen biosynthesis protein
MDSGWGGWDMEIYGSRYVKVRLTTATEHHHGVGMLTRVRVEFLMSRFNIILLGAGLMLAGLLLLHVWPFSRPAILIPLAWWTMYVVNKWRVTPPVLGLIDEAAEKAAFLPVPAKPVEKPSPTDSESTPQPVAAGHGHGDRHEQGDQELDEEGTPSIA